MVLLIKNKAVLKTQTQMNYTFILTCIICFFASTVGWSQQVSKTLHQTLTTDGAEKININVVGSKIEMRETKGSRILCEVTIRLAVSNERLLDFVANSGRYDLEKIVDNAVNELTISSQKSNNVIVVKGEEIREDISYIFYIPATVKFVNNSTVQDMSKE